MGFAFSGMDDAVAVVHRTVLLLVKREARLCSWAELLVALATRHPDLSQNSLSEIISAYPGLFSADDNDGVRLCQLDYKFVGHYFDLAECLEVVDRPTSEPYSLSEPCQVKASTRLLVKGLVGLAVSDGTEGGGSSGLLFQFDKQRAYRLRLSINQKGEFTNGQILRADISFRKDVNI